MSGPIFHIGSDKNLDDISFSLRARGSRYLTLLDLMTRLTGTRLNSIYGASIGQDEGTFTNCERKTQTNTQGRMQ